jgi:hypothetical protein
MSNFNNPQVQNFKNAIEKNQLLNEYIDFDGCVNVHNDIDTARESLLDSVSDCSIINYNNAVNFLLENDPSFLNSLGLAAEFGYTLNKLNSETLATLLLQNMLTEEINQVFQEI